MLYKILYEGILAFIAGFLGVEKNKQFFIGHWFQYASKELIKII